MVARSPTKSKKIAPALNPVLLRETLNKVDRCLARLQEMQFTIQGGRKVIAGVTLSPRSTRGYFRTSLRCKQESIRIRNGTPKKSPAGSVTSGEWQRMSLPAMLVNETVGEILQASQFARKVVSSLTDIDDPKTPITQRRKQHHQENSIDQLISARRRREKQMTLQNIRSDSNNTPSLLQRAKSRINFKVSPPKITTEFQKGKENFNHNNNSYVANRVSPRNKPWAKKTVLFPNPLFISTSTSNQQHKFCKTGSPMIGRNKRQTTPPHKFLIKSPVKKSPAAAKFQVKIRSKSPPVIVSRSPPKKFQVKIRSKSPPIISRSPKNSTMSKFRRSFSPSRLMNRLASPSKSRGVDGSPKLSTGAKLRRSFSPSRLVNRFASPMKSRKGVQRTDELMIPGMKQRPVLIPRRI